MPRDADADTAAAQAAMKPRFGAKSVRVSAELMGKRVVERMLNFLGRRLFAGRHARNDALNFLLLAAPGQVEACVIVGPRHRVHFVGASGLLELTNELGAA